MKANFSIFHMPLRARKTILALMLGGISIGAVTAADTDSQPGQPQQGCCNMSKENTRQMQDQMLKMHDLMHRIQASKDPTEREKLRQEHARLMNEQMQMMMSMMMGPGMMGDHGMMGQVMNGGGMGGMHNKQ